MRNAAFRFAFLFFVTFLAIKADPEHSLKQIFSDFTNQQEQQVNEWAKKIQDRKPGEYIEVPPHLEDKVNRRLYFLITEEHRKQPTGYNPLRLK